METIDGEPVLDRPSVAEVEAWFDTAGPGIRAVWLRLTRKGIEPASLTSDELVDVGLCFGWISAVRRRGDEETYLQRYTRRRPGSKWSRLNISKVERLTAEGRMRPAGMAEVRTARADGRWDNPWT
ncbi:YdeI family protein [Nocardioides sp. NPDC057577]|uniref:YdeI/OmpD-associated family protein n=1 Tax=Nocardioides sp. NPDC057577 TaxID=3346171 RepID=UPI00366EEBB2